MHRNCHVPVIDSLDLNNYVVAVEEISKFDCFYKLILIITTRQRPKNQELDSHFSQLATDLG